MPEHDALPDWLRPDADPPPPKRGTPSCPECDDGNGQCVFPHYGVAPHIHAGGNEQGLGSTQLLPKAMWDKNFEDDPEAPGHGTYLSCRACGASAA